MKDLYGYSNDGFVFFYDLCNLYGFDIEDLSVTFNGMRNNKADLTIDKVVAETEEIVKEGPNIVEVAKDFEVGTLAPTRTFKNKTGNTVIKWNIADLDPHEERIISFSLRAIVCSGVSRVFFTNC